VVDAWSLFAGVLLFAPEGALLIMGVVAELLSTGTLVECFESALIGADAILLSGAWSFLFRCVSHSFSFLVNDRRPSVVPSVGPYVRWVALALGVGVTTNGDHCA
jgi:hypothetical protein